MPCPLFVAAHGRASLENVHHRNHHSSAADRRPFYWKCHRWRMTLMIRFLITALVFASFPLSGNCDEHGVQIPAPLQRYSREKLAVRLTQFPSDSDHTKYKVTEKELWSRKWKAYYGEQTLTEPQFLEMAGCFELGRLARRRTSDPGSIPPTRIGLTMPFWTE